jgi:hypothetical protein
MILFLSNKSLDFTNRLIGLFANFFLTVGNNWLIISLTSCLMAIGFCLFPLDSLTQNLVYNPSFESDSAEAIHTYSQLKAGQTLVDGWYVPTDGTSDYYNSHQSTIRGHSIPKARTGQGRVAMIWANASQSIYREFLTGRLIKPLEKNKKYKISFYICRYKYAHFSPMQIGAYFSKDSMIQKNYHANIKVQPQMKIEDYTVLDDRKYWHKVEAVFTANGDEKFVTLGNFKQTINDLNSPAIKVSNKFTIVATGTYAYCFVDDLSVEEYFPNEEENMKKKKLYLYLVDKSSSMKKDDKFNRMKDGIKKSLKKLPADAEFSIISFSNQPKTVLQPTKTILYDLADAMDTISVKGQTNAISAINFAYDFKEFNSDYDIELIMCTDGQFKLDDSTFKRVLDTKMHFNLFQMGGMRNAYLDNLMNATGGKYIVSQKKNIKEDIIKLSSSVTENMGEVEYTKPKKKWVLAKWGLLLSLAALVLTL